MQIVKQGNAPRACVICGDAADVEFHCAFDAVGYVRCRRCGLVYTDTIPSEAAMNAAYTGGSIRKLRRRVLAPFRKLHQHRHFHRSMERARGIFNFALEQLTERRSDLRFLDIGCNRGYLLAAALEHGAQIQGIELVPEMVRPFCNSYPRLRDRIYSQKLSQIAPRLDDGSFDLITAIDVVEHFEDPAHDLNQVHRLLRPGGAFVIQTPDAACAEASREGCAWGALKPLEHLHLFSRANFATFAQAIGFHVVSVGEPFEHADGNFAAVLTR